MKSLKWGTTLVGLALLAGSAQAANLCGGLAHIGDNVCINFDDLPTSTITVGAGGLMVSPVTVVTNQYQAADGVTFSVTSTDPGTFGLLVEPNSGYQTDSTPNVTSIGTTGGILMYDSTMNLIITFANPASQLTFDTFGNDTTPPGNQFAQVDIYENGSVTPTATNFALLTTTGSASSGTLPDSIDLSAFSNISKLVIHNDTDSNGTAFDNFAFAASNAVGVPEPSSFLLLGLGGLLFAGRRYFARKQA